MNNGYFPKPGCPEIKINWKSRLLAVNLSLKQYLQTSLSSSFIRIYCIACSIIFISVYLCRHVSFRFPYLISKQSFPPSSNNAINVSVSVLGHIAFWSLPIKSSWSLKFCLMLSYSTSSPFGIRIIFLENSLPLKQK